jgi:hypothetical protein
MDAPRPGWLSDALTEAMDREFRRTRAAARRELAERLNQGLRLLRRFENERQWSSAVLDAARPFAVRLAFFAVGERGLRFLGARGAGEISLGEVPLDAAPAFRNAVDSAEPVVALRSASELSEPIARSLNESPRETCHLFPLDASGRVAAVLYAEPADPRTDPAALELVATLAASALAAHLATNGASGSSNPVTISVSGQPSNPETEVHSSWAALSREEQEQHLRAQRFARVRVAEMRLYQAGAVDSGRAQRDLYSVLRPQIDAGREGFRDQFLNSCASMVDYLHVELVRTLANDDGTLLGPGYPGPLV